MPTAWKVVRCPASNRTPTDAHEGKLGSSLNEPRQRTPTDAHADGETMRLQSLGLELGSLNDMGDVSDCSTHATM